jgi:hypothetical protein
MSCAAPEGMVRKLTALSILEPALAPIPWNFASALGALPGRCAFTEAEALWTSPEERRISQRHGHARALKPKGAQNVLSNLFSAALGLPPAL